MAYLISAFPRIFNAKRRIGRIPESALRLGRNHARLSGGEAAGLAAPGWPLWRAYMAIGRGDLSASSAPGPFCFSSYRRDGSPQRGRPSAAAAPDWQRRQRGAVKRKAEAPRSGNGLGSFTALASLLAHCAAASRASGSNSADGRYLRLTVTVRPRRNAARGRAAARSRAGCP